MAPVALAAASAVGGRPGGAADPFFDIATPVPPSIAAGSPDAGASWSEWVGGLLTRAGSVLPSGQVVAGAAVVAAVGGVIGYLVARTMERAEADKRPAGAATAIVFRTQGNQALAVSAEPDAPSGSVSPAHLHVGVCTVCFDAPCNTIFAPCGHMCTCSGCADQLHSTCPLCRAEVHDRIVIREVKA